ncbi:hypothetical protein [uncultured Desulfuromusa sp.]|uniref:hypothetical protein n=1 Tax=uncultured Desulfuromusa sp. TaxID=219183 RepID=UPI002AA69A5B|nr:hypothetical protein [uncultured Desulfuromusa sp.]
MREWRCNVLNCGGGECVHELTDEKCPHCGLRMVKVKPTGFMFCSNDSMICDYEKNFQNKDYANYAKNE